MYLTDMSYKAMTVTDSDLDVNAVYNGGKSSQAKAHGLGEKVKIAVTSLVDGQIMPGRLTQEMRPAQIKLALFTILRQYISYDAFKGITKDNLRNYFDWDSMQSSGFGDGERIYKALTSTDVRMSMSDRAVWEAIADGSLRLVGCDERQQAHIGRLVRSFINAGASPIVLFRAQRFDNTSGQFVQDGITSPSWNPVLSRVNGVRPDDVFAFANWIDPDFCPPDARQMSIEEFSQSDYFIALVDNELKVNFSVTGDKENVAVRGSNDAADHMSIGTIYVSGVRSTGQTSSSNVSQQGAFNNMMTFVEMMRNGTMGANTHEVVRGLNNYRSRYSNEDLNAITKHYQRENHEGTMSGNLTRGIEPVQVKYVKQPNLGGRQAELLQENVMRHSRFFETVPEVYSETEHDTFITHEQKQKILNKYTRRYGNQFSWNTLMNLVVMRLGWTSVSSDKATGALSYADFAWAEHEINLALNCENPSLSAIFKVDSTAGPASNKERVSFGVMDVDNLKQFIQATGNIFDYNEAVEIMKSNLANSKSIIFDQPTNSPKQKNLLNNYDYFNLIWNNTIRDEKFDFMLSCSNLKSMIDNDSEIFYNISPADKAELKRVLTDADFFAEAERLIDMNTKYDTYEYDTASGSQKIVRNKNLSRSKARNAMRKIVKIRQMTAMLGASIPVANALDTFKGTKISELAATLGNHGIGPRAHTMSRRIKVNDEVINAAVNNKNTTTVVEAYRLAKTLEEQRPGTLNELDNWISEGRSVEDWVNEKSTIKKGQIFEGLWAKAMRFGSASDIARKSMFRNFITRFQEVAGKERLDMLQPDGLLSLEKQLAEDPTSTILRLFRDGSPYRKYAMDALEYAESCAMNQNNNMTFLVNRVIMRGDTSKFISAVFLGVPFMKASINITGRTLKWVLPGLSTTNYLVTDWIARNPEVFTNPDKGVGKLLMLSRRAKTPAELEALHKEFAANADAYKGYVDLREAIYVDLVHLSLPLIALAFAACGAVQPPQGGATDDDTGLNSRYNDYTEWTIFGQPMSDSWWLSDLLGQVYPFMCYWKALLDGNSGGAVLLSGVAQSLNMSPLTSIDGIIDLIVNPDKCLEEYMSDTDYYDESPDTIQEILLSESEIGMYRMANVFTPKIIKEISQIASPYEVSYNRVYETNATGSLVEGAVENGLTVKTDYTDAQIRKLTRNNYLLGQIANFLKQGTYTTGYTAAEMPNQYTYDTEQLAFMHNYSVWDYDNETYKSTEEIEEVCASIITILEQNDDMDALYKEGFYLDSYTKKAVSDYIWNLYQDEIDSWNDLEQSGALEYTTAGDGDYTKGMQIVSELKEKHYAILSHYKQTLYYDKLRSDDLNQGLIKYTRYNTTYKVDSNGNYYASGIRQGLGGVLAPFGVVENSNTNDYSGGYATTSSLSGEGMYDENGLPIRAVEEVKTDDYDWPSFDEIESTAVRTEGDSDSDNDSTSSSSSSSGYKSYSRSGSSGGSSSRSSRSYSSSGSSYIRSSSGKTYGQGSRVYAPTYTNGRRTTSSHNVNFNRPNLPNVLDAKKIYDPTLDYLRPDFETKGSREAYRRSDF
jgi:hypothetical protein